MHISSLKTACLSRYDSKRRWAFDTPKSSKCSKEWGKYFRTNCTNLASYVGNHPRRNKTDNTCLRNDHRHHHVCARYATPACSCRLNGVGYLITTHNV